MIESLLQKGLDPAACSLEDLRQAAWRDLASACGSPSHPWRLPSLANVAGGAPRQRTVVLRQVDTAQGHLLAHTDLRSSKCAQLLENPSVSWLFYEPEQRVQLVMSGQVHLHTQDSVADTLWSESSPINLVPYQAPWAPGTPFPRPVTNLSEARATTHSADDCRGREHFVALVGHVSEIDLLFINREGNLRCHFSRQESTWQQSWLAP